MNKNIKFKITDNTGKKDLSRFSISYSFKRLEKEQASYEILSALKEDNDIIIEITSSLMNMNENANKILLDKLVNSFDELGIEYTKKKVVANAKRSILSITIEGKKVEGFEFYAYIPNEIWKSQSFINALPDNGVMYYILKPEHEFDLISFSNFDEDEKTELCQMAIFDNTLLSSMGINTSVVNKDNIMELLRNN